MIAGRRLSTQTCASHHRPTKEWPALNALIQNRVGAGEVAAELQHRRMQVVVVWRVSSRRYRVGHVDNGGGNLTEGGAQSGQLRPQSSGNIVTLFQQLKAGASRKHFADVAERLRKFEKQPGFVGQRGLHHVQPLAGGGLRLCTSQHHLAQLDAKQRFVRQALDQRFKRRLRSDQLVVRQVALKATPETAFADGKRVRIHSAMIASHAVAFVQFATGDRVAESLPLACAIRLRLDQIAVSPRMVCSMQHGRPACLCRRATQLRADTVGDVRVVLIRASLKDAYPFAGAGNQC